jgi:MFS family permease
VAYLHFILKNARFLGFGALLTFFGNFGQTYYIALFSAPIRAEFGLSHGDFGLLYATATVSSAACLVWAGRKIDDVDLRVYVSAACAVYALACFLLSAAGGSASVLVAALFLLRMTGQGLMGHSAMTGMARYFTQQRGKAMSIAALGHPIGEAVLPSIAVMMLSAYGWRPTWQITGAIIAAILIPGVLLLLRGHGERHRRHIESLKNISRDAHAERRQWTRSDVIRDPAFYGVLPCALAAPLILTGLFFHQVHLAESKGWSLAWMATCFIGYAVATVIGSLVTGALVDRFGATRILPWYLLPLGGGLGALILFEHAGAAMVYLVAAGATTGASSVTLTATWAEIYGTAHIGAIRALVSACMVFSTALAPAIMGWGIDRGVSMETIVSVCVVYIGLCIVLVVGALARLKARRTRVGES